MAGAAESFPQPFAHRWWQPCETRRAKHHCAPKGDINTNNKENASMKFTIPFAFIIATLAAAASLPAQEKPAPAIERAIAVIHPTAGHEISGTVKFTKEAGGIHVVAEIKGLAPGKHGFHIHEFG